MGLTLCKVSRKDLDRSGVFVDSVELSRAPESGKALGSSEGNFRRIDILSAVAPTPFLSLE
jgi:hypothetical protein